MNKQAPTIKKKQRGQSYVELAIILMLLIFMLVGVVEFGYLLNQYITLVEGSRETARTASKGQPFVDPEDNDFRVRDDFLDRISILLEGGVIHETGQQVMGSINPLAIDPDIGDDIVISIFSFDDDKNITRFPLDNGENGWSRHGNQVSRFSNSDIQARLATGAPGTGAILIEVFYHYHQILNLMEGWVGPILVHTYSIMPLSAAEPTRVP
jgi:hypothetical protein